jgi:hypothetical protein
MSYPRARQEKSLWVTTGWLAGLISNLMSRNFYPAKAGELQFFSRPSHFVSHMELWNIGFQHSDWGEALKLLLYHHTLIESI